MTVPKGRLVGRWVVASLGSLTATTLLQQGCLSSHSDSSE